MQYTQIGSCTSSLQKVGYGVPQGSILGPVLFLLYINDIKSCMTTGNLKLFADDTAILISHTNLAALNVLANDTMQNVDSWLKMNKLSLNLQKTYCLHIHSNKKRADSWSPTIKIGNHQIEVTHRTKYLGVIIDDKLSFKDHVNYLVTKLRRWIGIFRKIGPLLTTPTKRMLYQSAFLSNVTYGIEIYGNTTNSDMKHLQIVQSKALKALFGYPRLFPTLKLYKELNFHQIVTLYKYRASILLDRILNQKEFSLNIQTSIKSYCSPMEHKYDTRKKLNFNLRYDRPSYTSSHTFKLFLLWNSIPPDIKSAASQISFKSSLLQIFSL